MWLEARLTKNEILKLYLDRAYMGGGAFGVDAAAQYYFNKSARDVEPRRSGDARRPVQGADQVFAQRQPAGGARARQRRARQSGRRRLHDRGPGVRRPPQSRHPRRPPRRPRAELLSRLGLRRDEEAGRHLPEIDDRARLRGAHRARHQSAACGGQRGGKFAAPIRPGISRRPGRRRADGRRRLGARHGRRARLRRQPVQPRHRRDAPARLLVQALRLFHRARARPEAELDRGRCADLHRQLVPAQLRRRLWRLDDADHRADPFDQHRRRAAVGRGRRRQRQARPRAHHQDRARHGHHHAAARHAVAADRRRRGRR